MEEELEELDEADEEDTEAVTGLFGVLPGLEAVVLEEELLLDGPVLSGTDGVE